MGGTKLEQISRSGVPFHTHKCKCAVKERMNEANDQNDPCRPVGQSLTPYAGTLLHAIMQKNETYEKCYLPHK